MHEWYIGYQGHNWVKRSEIHFIIITSVACVVGPSVTTSLTDFSFQNLVFWEFIWIFSSGNHPKINISHILNSKSYQINSIKSCSSRSFRQYQMHIPIPPKFLATIKFNFQWRNHSIFKNFCTASPNIMEPSPCTPPHRELFQRHQEHNLKHPSSIDLITTKQNKTNYLPS
jgi:hypothetical protein